MKITDENGRVFEGSADELKGFGFDVELQADEEVLSEDNVKEGDYFVVMDNNNVHKFSIGEIVKAISYTDCRTFKAEHLDGSDWWNVRYTDVRRATDAEIAEATKPKEVKFEVGDVVKGDNRFAQVNSVIDTDGDYSVKYLDNGSHSFYKPSAMRHATEEEKSHLQTLIGRGKDEYKVGDLARLEATGLRNSLRNHIGCIFEVGNINRAGAIHLTLGDNRSDTLAYTNPENLKLIVPVEYRHDFVEVE